jgi:hypothetical protein
MKFCAHFLVRNIEYFTYYKAVRVGGGGQWRGDPYFNTGCAYFPWSLAMRYDWDLSTR